MKTLKELEEIRDKIHFQLQMRQEDSDAVQIFVAMGTCGIAAGARDVLHAFSEELRNKNLGKVKLMQTGCVGNCECEPIVQVLVPGQEKVTYLHMTCEKAKKVVQEHIVNQKIVEEYTIAANS